MITNRGRTGVGPLELQCGACFVEEVVYAVVALDCVCAVEGVMVRSCLCRNVVNGGGVT